MKGIFIDTFTNKIKIDIDSKNRYFISDFKRKLFLFFNSCKEYYKINSIEVYETNKGYHIILTLNKYISSLECNFIELFLNSDENRQLNNFIRFKKNSNCESVLFKNKFKTINKNIIITGENITENSKKLKKAIKKILRKTGVYYDDK